MIWTVAPARFVLSTSLTVIVDGDGRGRIVLRVAERRRLDSSQHRRVVDRRHRDRCESARCCPAAPSFTLKLTVRVAALGLSLVFWYFTARNAAW